LTAVGLWRGGRDWWRLELGLGLELIALASMVMASATAGSFLVKKGLRCKIWRRGRRRRDGRRRVVWERISGCIPQAASFPYHTDLLFVSILSDRIRRLGVGLNQRYYRYSAAIVNRGCIVFTIKAFFGF
jgi:hypothetical protein